MRHKLLELVVLFIAIGPIAVSAAPTVVHDESVNGEAGDESLPIDLGTLAAGTYIILGHVSLDGAFGPIDAGDAYKTAVATGFEISDISVTLTHLSGTEGVSRLRGYDPFRLAPLVGPPGDVIADFYAWSGTLPGGETWGFSNFLADFDTAYDYQWEFTVRAVGSTEPESEPPSEVPEPTTLSLLGLGLAGIGFARRRRKA